MSDLKWTGQHEHFFRLKAWMTYSVSKTKTTLYFLKMSKCHKIFMHILTRLIFMSNVCTGTKMAFSMVLSIINKICTPQTMNAILANQSAINYSINTRHMTSNGLISLTRLLHHLCINICVFTCTYLKNRRAGGQEGINSWARLSDVPGHRDVTAKWSVRRAEFSKMAVLLFFMWTLWAYFFPCHEAAMWFLFWSRIPLPYIPTEEVSAFWLLRENSAKKVSEGFRWVSKLRKLCECGATFRSTKTRFSLDKKHEKTCSFAPK